MPTYEYICAKCGKQFDLVQSIMDKPLTICPKEHCLQKTWGKGKVKRLISAGGGLLFKGSGFYITDYRSDSYKQAASRDSSAGSAKAGTSSGGADTAKSGSDSKSSSALPAASTSATPTPTTVSSKPASSKSSRST